MMMPIKNKNRIRFKLVGVIMIAWTLIGVGNEVLHDFFLRAVQYSGFEQYEFATNILTQFIIIPIAALLGGSFIIFTKDSFRTIPFLTRILIEIILFIILVFILTIIGSFVYNYIYFDAADQPGIWLEVKETMFSYGMLYNIAFWTAIGSITVLVVQVIDFFGRERFYNTFTGKYYQPIVEERIFLFLDLKNSTGLAEQWGHQKWFSFINTFIKDIADTIINTQGEVYQYIGDEIVVSWPAAKGFKNNQALSCFFEIQKIVNKHADRYKEKFGIVPEFRASLHAGEVTAGEIGLYRKDIIFTGDVLNTAKRIQGYCDALEADFLVSGDTFLRMSHPENWKIYKESVLQLKGKSESIKVLIVLPDNNE